MAATTFSGRIWSQKCQFAMTMTADAELSYWSLGQWNNWVYAKINTDSSDQIGINEYWKARSTNNTSLRIDIAFIWDIPELSIRYIGEIIAKKVILTPSLATSKKPLEVWIWIFLLSRKMGVKITFFTIISPIYRIESSGMSHMKAISILHSKW